VIEVLTSIYAHKIAGYLVDLYNLDDDIKRELEFGLNITRDFLGREPKGVWLPEMSFSMKLIPIIASLGLEYTFLDERYHLRFAEGDVKNHYELYEVQDGSGNKLVVFFRDTELSDDIAFANNYCSEIHAIKGAYRFVNKMLSKCVDNKAKLLTIALDGENWMALSANPPATAIFLKTLIYLFKKLSKLGIIETVRAEEAVKLLQPTRKLRFIPSTTWLGSYKKWRGEVSEHEVFWNMVEQRISRYREYVSKHGFDDKAEKMKWALWHILDSDYWWAEFWNKEMINIWIAEFDKYLQ
jgi:alpha-amylase/alpha-mannosidase (GH57 family)